MKIFDKHFTSVVVIYFSYSIGLLGDQEQMIEHYAQRVSNSDIAYKISFADQSTVPSRIEILIHTKNENQAIDSLRKAPIENINSHLAKDSRVYFFKQSENNKKTEVWSFAEQDGKIRIHDRKEKKGYWIELAAFLEIVVEKSKGGIKHHARP